MKNIIFFVLLCFSVIIEASTYNSLRTGTLKGKLIVQWIEPDVFLFIPDKENPLTFTRYNGKKITPGRMQTDGGSIPRPIWAIRNYSPWGYAPAYIIHDWIFHIKKCQTNNYKDFSFELSATIMGEVIKTMMESSTVDKDPTTVNLMVGAVNSFIAKKYWDTGICIPTLPAFNITPKMEYMIEYK